MSRYIDADELKDNFCDACATLKRYGRTVEECRNKTDTYGNRCFKMRLIDKTPTADVVPKSEVAREIVAKFKTKMHSEIARNKLLAEYGDDFYEGRIDAFLTAIDCLTEIAMGYAEDKNDI